MTIFTKTIKTALLGVILGVFMSAPVFAEDDQICAPFEDSHVDKNLLASMLKAAEDGHLYRIKPDSSKMGFCINLSLIHI